MQNDIIRLIVIEETPNDADVILNSLRKARYPIRPRYVEDEEDLEDALTGHEWDLVITIPEVGDFKVAQVCDMVSDSKQDIPVIVLAEMSECNNMTEFLKVGVTQIIPRNNCVCLPHIVGRELNNLDKRRKLKLIEQLYKESQKHNKILLETSRDAIAYVHEGMHTHANSSYLKMFDYKSMDDLGGLPMMDLIISNDHSKCREFMREFVNDERAEERQIELEGLKSNKKRFKLAMEVSHAIYDSERCIQVIIRDKQSQSQEVEKQMLQLSRRDQLTGLFNRQYFLELLENSLARAIETGTRSVLFYIALDKFSTVMENIGIGGRDPVVKNIAKIIGDLFPKVGTLARFEDSVFTLLVADKDGKKYAGADKIADKICKVVAATVTELEEQSVIVTCSIGITQVLTTTTTQQVLTAAHTACKIAMEQGGNRFEMYKPGQTKTGQGGGIDSDIANLIETAIEEKRLSLRFQPILSLLGEELEIYELFLRMVDGDGKNIPPGELFDAAEKSNLTIKLDNWVLQEGVNALVKQQKEGHQTHFFIKLSDQTIRDEKTLLFIRKLLKSSQLPGERLILEISESIAISHVNLAKSFISQLKTFGCKSALEHFGTGLNFASTLELIPVDYVKIDRQFTKDLATNTENQQTVQDIVKIAHDLGKLTIAEAVEDSNSLMVLYSSEVDFAQGHYIQEPLEDMEFDFSEEEE